MRLDSGIKSNRTGFKGLFDAMLAKNLGRILSIPGAIKYRHFEKITQDPAGTQLRILRDILSYAADTAFGREHGFSNISTYEEYKRHVAVMDYEDHRPYIERHQKGERGVLFPGKPLMYNCSSGTTSKPKLLPVTPYNFKTSVKKRSKLWLYGIMKQYPGIYDGKHLGVVSPAEEGVTEDGTPFGSLSGLINKNLPHFINSVRTAPYEVVLIKNYTARTYVVCRFALPCDVTLIVTANPATILNIVVRIDEWKESLLRDIHDGTLSSDVEIEPEIRENLVSRLRPAPQRAAEIEALMKKNHPLRPDDYWPNLKLIHTWTNGNTGLVVPKLKVWFNPDTPVLDFGYVSSEVLSTDIIVPDKGGSVLSLESGFYEFVRFEEHAKQDRQYMMAHQLKKGERYFTYVTTHSGLYRYDMNDVVEVIDFFNKTPVLKFLFKAKGITNMQGEKLSEAQFIEAVGMATKKTGMVHDFYIGYADVGTSSYRIYIEFLEDYDETQIDGFGRALDDALCHVNIEFKAKLDSERLNPSVIICMGKDFFARYRKLRLDEGALEGQIKWLQLSGMETTRLRLEKLRNE